MKLGRFWGKVALITGIFAPLFTFAQGTGSGGVTLQNYIVAALSFINKFIIPVLFAIAFVMFIWGITKYFIIKGASEEDRASGKTLALWGILTFVFLLSIWGLTYALVTSFGIQNGKIICPDYNKNCNTGGNTSGAGGQNNTQNTPGNTNVRNPYQGLMPGGSTGPNQDPSTGRNLPAGGSTGPSQDPSTGSVFPSGGSTGPSQDPSYPANQGGGN